MIMEKNNNQNGFTLIEVLCALLVLAIGILGVAVLQNISIEGNSNAIRLTTAATWGGDAIETLMARPYDHGDLVDDNNDGITGLNFTDTPGSPADGGPLVHGNFTIFWNVADNYPVFGTKTMRVLARRQEKGTLRTVTLNFVKMEPI